MSKQRVTACLLCGALATLLSGSALAQSRSAEAERLFARAVQLHQSGDVEGAAREYAAVLVIDPNRVDARSNLGAALVRLGHYEKAIEQYRRALNLDTRNTAVRFNLALAYYKAARITDAADELSRVVAIKPGDTNAVLVLADCYFRLGEHKKIIELLTPLEAAFANDRAFAYLLGTALIEDNQLSRGQQFIDRILRDGNSGEAHVLLGSALMKSSDYPSAVKRFEMAIQLNPSLPNANSLYGQALMRTGDTERAAKAFEKELEINPNDFESNLFLGLLLKNEQRNDEALRLFERALLVRPGELNVRYFIATLQLAVGKSDEARLILEELVKEAPAFVEAHVSLATVYFRLKRKEDGNRERAIIQKLNGENQAKTAGAQDDLGPAYRGERGIELPAPKKPDAKPPQ